MSGIAGIIHFDGAPVEPGLIEKMTSAMSHRGPDGIHHWVKGNVALGQCMLRTTPESLEEHQPLADEDESLVLAMDGRVDNWEELRRELLGRGARLRDRSDAELVLRAYEAWGEECLPHIDGDFALIIWDARRRTAFCARDRMGHKPFSYHWRGNTLTIASELRAILRLPWVEKELDQGLLSEFLAADWLSRTDTFWKGVVRLEPSASLRASSESKIVSKYWKPDLWRRLPCSSDEDYVEYYRTTLTNTIRRAARSHTPVAFEVSGGLDSSAVFCLAENLRLAGHLRTPAILGYSFAGDSDADLDETEYSRAVGRHLHLSIEEVPLSQMPMSWYAEQGHFYEDFPGFVNGTMITGLRNEARQNGSSVIVTGEGGDQWLGGGHTYYGEMLALGEWRQLLQTFAGDTRANGLGSALSWLLRGGILRRLPQGLRVELRQTLDIALGRKKRQNRHPWLSSTMRSIYDERVARCARPALVPIAVPGQEALLRELGDAFFTQALECSERNGARLGLEIRHPLRSPDIVQFAFSVPERLRRRGRVNKLIHRLAIRGIAPTRVVERTTKASSDGVFRRQLKQLEETFLRRIPLTRADWVSPDEIKTLFSGYISGAADQSYEWPLWAVAACDAWLD
jgi:asparagine synthase (glutamine-hydrolysing)